MQAKVSPVRRHTKAKKGRKMGSLSFGPGYWLRMLPLLRNRGSGGQRWDAALPARAMDFRWTWLEHAHRMPGLRDYLGALGAEQLARIGDCQLCEVREGRRGPRFEPGVEQRRIPDRARLVPGIPPESVCGQEEGPVRNAGIDVDSAVVLVGLDIST
jgi:hypothetical protein